MSSRARLARERAREEITDEIRTVARRQLGEVGAAALSLRAVAREMGMAPSALFRYVASSVVTKSPEITRKAFSGLLYGKA